MAVNGLSSLALACEDGSVTVQHLVVNTSDNWMENSFKMDDVSGLSAVTAEIRHYVQLTDEPISHVCYLDSQKED